jgi:hypothetical protein
MTFVWDDVQFGLTADPDTINAMGEAVQLHDSLLQGGVHTSIDACRVTTAGAYLTTSADPTEAVKLRSAPMSVVAGQLYRVHGQTLYTAADPWALEIHKDTISGTFIGGCRLDVSAAGNTGSWDVDWPCLVTETTQLYYVVNRLSGASSISLFGINDGYFHTFANVDRVGANTLLRDVP